ncbi:MAG: hypothetical protein SGPRY_011541 [Prymnesium sp.]
MATFKPLYLPFEKPFFRDYYRSVQQCGLNSSRGINGPVFSRKYCGGSNANGDAFRRWGEPADESRERGAAEWHIERTRSQRSVLLSSRSSEKDFIASLKWPPRTAWTRAADGTALPSLQ